jgi:hypothetical protein
VSVSVLAVVFAFERWMLTIIRAKLDYVLKSLKQLGFMHALSVGKATSLV